MPGALLRSGGPDADDPESSCQRVGAVLEYVLAALPAARPGSSPNAPAVTPDVTHKEVS